MIDHHLSNGLFNSRVHVRGERRDRVWWLTGGGL
jgi:hypothetical protein